MAKFKKGESGNPAGKPAGVPNKATKLRALLEPHAEELVSKAVALAKYGDTVALRLCLERLIPAIKSERLPVRLPALGTVASLTEQGRAILSALGDGQLSPDGAAVLMQTVSGQLRIEEFDELRRRVDALEAKQS